MQAHFNEEKTTQAAALLLKLRGDKMSYMKLIKLLYIVDREAIRRWGFPVTGDAYFSMKHGPVLSGVLDLVNESPDDASYWHQHISEPTVGKELTLTKPVSTEMLSQAEIDLITEVFKSYGHLTRWTVRDVTHTFPEWQNPGAGHQEISYQEILVAVGKSPDEAEETADEIENANFVNNLLQCRR